MSISGAIISPNNPNSYLIAERLYNEIRHRKTDYINVAHNTQFSTEQCKIVKDYIFMNSHELSTGFGRFAPDISMAQSWLRLAEKAGRNIQRHDVVLLFHELTEIIIQLQNPKISQLMAHEQAQLQYNYVDACRKYYESLGIKI